jgi:hypothetical protein
MFLTYLYSYRWIISRGSECWYLIDCNWLNKWSQFVRGGLEEEAPGIISSKDLLDADGNPLPGLKAKLDYRGVTPMIFYLLVELHGRDKSPEICRYDVDIYQRPVPPDRLLKISYKAAVSWSDLRYINNSNNYYSDYSDYYDYC